MRIEQRETSSRRQRKVRDKCVCRLFVRHVFVMVSLWRCGAARKEGSTRLQMRWTALECVRELLLRRQWCSRQWIWCTASLVEKHHRTTSQPHLLLSCEGRNGHPDANGWKELQPSTKSRWVNAKDPLKLTWRFHVKKLRYDQYQ